MTQRKNSAHNHLQHQWQRSLPAQSLCWLSSFSLLSGGLVYAQTESAAIDNIVPTAENSGSAAVVNNVKKDTTERNRSASVPEPASEQEFSQRRAKLRQRLHNKEEISQSAQPVRNQHKNEASEEPVVVIRKSRPQVEDSATGAGVSHLSAKLETSRRVPLIRREEKTQADSTSPTAQSSSSEKVPQATKPLNNSNSSGSRAAEKPKDYNNALIDPTNYSAADATHKYYEAPSSVVITERSSGCRTVLASGQGISGSSCANTPSRSQPLADSDTKLQGKHVPSWIGRSQTAHLVNVTSDQRVSTSTTNTLIRPNRIASSDVTNTPIRSTRIASGGVTKSDYHPNRFIPNNFIPTTTVSSTPLAPVGGALPAPMTSDNLAPRPSTVAYNIPLASTLPQIAYSSVYGGRLASGFAGLMFPLTVPAPITSLFGWRIHPITGDRRFHSGTDLGAAMGTPVLAAYPGKVEMADWVGGYGLTVILNHNNAQQTLYGHMSQILVQPGQWVEQGTVVGLVGSTGNSTGPHLHFEIRQLTPEGWVATDPGAQLETALSQLVHSLQTAQTPQQTESNNPATRRLN